MYVPPHDRFDDAAALWEFLREHPFALLISAVDGVPLATSIPVTVSQEGSSLALRGHLARANPQADSLDGALVLVVFSGPHAYVSPRHYGAERSVPTWNYVAVQASGTARTLPAEDVPGHEALLAELIAEHEPSYQTRWDGFPDGFRHAMLRGIVGFEMPVDRLEGRAKLSGNKSVAQRRRIAAALAAADHPLARDTGRWMARRERPAGGEDRSAPERDAPASNGCPFPSTDDA
jgi:transcriptional regulator